jgi:ankyrin repeat protein
MHKKYTRQELLAWTQRREGHLIHELAALSENERIRALLSKDTGLLREGDAEDATPLHYASAVGNPETLKLLLAFGAHVNAANVHEETPLLWALIEPDILYRREKIAALIQARARINHANIDGETALHQSFRDNRITQFLLAHGANVHAENIYQWTPLHYAVLYDDFIESTQQLLAHNANPNAADDEGLTPLHLTTQNMGIQTAEVLLAAGANRKAKDNQGRTPYDTAQELDAPELLLNLLKP